MLATLPSARLACLNVLKLGRITIDRTLDEQGNNKHIDRLVALRHWASPLELDESRLTVHVLEAIDPASAILEFTEVNHVDHIVIGARQNSMLRTLLGSVSAKVAAEAACTVTVVRPPRSPAAQKPAAAIPDRSTPRSAEIDSDFERLDHSSVWTWRRRLGRRRRRRCGRQRGRSLPLREVATRALVGGRGVAGLDRHGLPPSRRARRPSRLASGAAMSGDRSNPQDRAIEGPAV